MFHFIVNSYARSGKGRSFWSRIERKLNSLIIEHRVYFTDRNNSGANIARLICENNEKKTIVAVGGDGMVNQVINGISDFKNTTFGYIPIGSGNDFSRCMELPVVTMKALESILYSRNIREIDIPICQFKDSTKRFAIASGAGYDASISFEASEKSRIKSILNFLKLGQFTYVLIAIKQIINYDPTPVILTLDNGNPIKFPRVFMTVVMNLQSEGVGMRMCPDAEPDDGVLNICLVGNMNKFKLACSLPLTFFLENTQT